MSEIIFDELYSIWDKYVLKPVFIEWNYMKIKHRSDDNPILKGSLYCQQIDQ